MKPRWQFGWILFAIAMVWGECMGDVPRLVLPHHTTPAHFVVALANATAVLGVTFYALRYTRTRAFWRLFAPLYALFLAAEVGVSFVSLTRVVAGLLALGKDAPLVILGGIVVLLPIMAMAVFTVIAALGIGSDQRAGRSAFARCSSAYQYSIATVRSCALFTWLQIMRLCPSPASTKSATGSGQRSERRPG